MSDDTHAAMNAQLDLLRLLGAPGICHCGHVLSGAELVRTRTSATPPRDILEYQCAECGRVSVFPYTPPAAPSTAVTLDADAVTFTISGVGALPQGSVITVSVVVGPDGPVVAPPAAAPTEAPKPRRYMNEGR